MVEKISNYYKYGEKEMEYLKGRDRILGKEIDRRGMVKREVETDIFSALISSIVSQQISTQAAITVKGRLKRLVGEIKPYNIANSNLESIQKCGMSLRKAEYIRGVAEAVLAEKIDLDKLYSLSDKEVVEKLTELRGVGEWTAEMLLIHSLQRPNILSYKDFAIRKGLMKLYGLDELTREQFEKYKETYHPYATVASIYIWEISASDNKK